MSNDVIELRCKVCGAPKDMPCVSFTGREMTERHIPATDLQFTKREKPLAKLYDELRGVEE